MSWEEENPRPQVMERTEKPLQEGDHCPEMASTAVGKLCFLLWVTCFISHSQMSDRETEAQQC